MIGNAMLVTSCPECDTTFRITVGILEKAGGQVRCGRCAKIFDANVDLREVDESEVERKPAPGFKFELQPEPRSGTAAEARTAPESEPEPEPEADAETTGAASESTETPPDSEAEGGDATEPADAAGETRVGEPAGPAALPEPESAPPQPDPDPSAAFAAPDWLRPPEPAESERRRNRYWAAGAAAAALLAAGQLVHHYREPLVATPAIGPALARVYAWFGAEVRAPVDLDQYDLLDLTAVAEPEGENRGRLVIEARVLNKGPKIQRYPYIYLRLLDRWEATIAARYFAPEEYAVASISDVDRMNVGSMIDAQFKIMDPGPAATGFELELCVKTVRGFECESDDVDE